MTPAVNVLHSLQFLHNTTKKGSSFKTFFARVWNMHHKNIWQRINMYKKLKVRLLTKTNELEQQQATSGKWHTVCSL